MYVGIKRAIGLTAQTCGVLKQKDGTVIKDKSEKLNRWIEHYSEVYTGQSQVSSDTIASLPNVPPMNDLDSEPDLEEVAAAIKRMPHSKAAGEDAIPAEVLKAGIEPLVERLHHLVESTPGVQERENNNPKRRSSLRQLQELLNGFSQSCADFGLNISLKKTMTLSSELHDSHQFTINDTTLDRVNKFTYLGSSMTANATLDQEIYVRLGKAASTFERLSNAAVVGPLRDVIRSADSDTRPSSP
ncbi:hypothetical protein SKAU_G00260560 [Synaphobranchus kaupii]|uniref:Uncharacterized protein n=1 Tax=Synaphobranchus kaupii TaxID=118154 RepID=A0A9Q1F4R6_SYNKA|nr:hypothetical protein SKAU_G00260560 [Synaphobranchus kaupii]